MDLDIKINFLGFTLKNMCATVVGCQVIEAVIPRQEVDHVEVDKYAKDAIQILKKLHLPPAVVKAMECMYCFKPIASELIDWYRKSAGVRPIWKSFGTVDMVKSTLIFLGEDRPDGRIQRFMLASVFCLEDFIFDIGGQLTSYEKSTIRNSSSSSRNDFHLMEIWTGLPKFWLDAIQGKFGTLINGRHLSPRACDKGFKVAMESLKYGGSDVAVNYFINKVSSEKIFHDEISRLLSRFHYKSAYEYLPSTIRLIFSKLKEPMQLAYAHMFGFWLLIAHLEWPYQKFFVQVALGYTNLLKRYEFWFVMQTILEKIVDGKDDCDYSTLFYDFWELGAFQRRRTPVKKYERRRAMICVFQAGDEQLINFVLSSHTTKQKEALLMEFNENCICDTLLHNGDYQMLEVFIKGCGMHSLALLQNFRGAFLANFPHHSCRLTEGKIHRDKWFAGWESDKWLAAQDIFSKLMDKIIAEKRSAAAKV